MTCHSRQRLTVSQRRIRELILCHELVGASVHLPDDGITPMLTQYEANGWLVIENLLSREERQALVDHMMDVFEGRLRVPWYTAPTAEQLASDPLARYRCPLNCHRSDPIQQMAATKPRIKAILSEIMPSAPRLMQTMFICKPPGDKGVCMHQDSYYIRNEPDTLHGCWIALDDADERNGGLRVVKASHRKPLLPV